MPSLLLGSLSALAQSTPNVEAHHQPETIKLDLDTCPVVHENDTVVASLKPLFTPSDLVAENYEISFIKDDVAPDVYAINPNSANMGLILRNNGVSKGEDGFWKVSFHVPSITLPDGKYTLRMIFSRTGGSQHYAGTDATENSQQNPALTRYCVSIRAGYEPPAPSSGRGVEIKPTH